MLVEDLFNKINELSSQVEGLLKNEDEAECESLLNQRQLLLEQLSELVTKSTGGDTSSEQFIQYREFLKSIQKRDALSLQFAMKQCQELFAERSKQVKSKKAIKAYQKLML